MFDAKQLLDALIAGAGQQNQQPNQQAPQTGGLGGLLGQVMGAVQGNQGGQSGAGAGGLGGLGGLLGSVLGQVQNSAQQAGQAAQQAGGVGGILGSILKQATSGVGQAAGQVDQATGAGGKLDDLLRQATGGKGGADILAQLQQAIGQNQGAAGAILGGLGGLLLGTEKGRSVTMDAAKLGGLVLIGGLAYKAYQNYLEGKPLIEMGEPVSPPPTNSLFDAEAGDGQQNAVLMLRAMIAAAAADGLIDETERAAILGNVQALGIDQATLDFLQDETANPATAETLAAEVQGPEQAAQLYTAARLAVDLDNDDEQQFMADLAAQLGLDEQLVAQLEAAAASVKV